MLCMNRCERGRNYDPRLLQRTVYTLPPLLQQQALVRMLLRKHSRSTLAASMPRQRCFPKLVNATPRLSPTQRAEDAAEQHTPAIGNRQISSELFTSQGRASIGCLCD